MKQDPNSASKQDIDKLLKRIEELEAKIEPKKEIVINTKLVQYRVGENTINCMLLGGHRFELKFQTLRELNAAYLCTAF